MSARSSYGQRVAITCLMCHRQTAYPRVCHSAVGRGLHLLAYIARMPFDPKTTPRVYNLAGKTRHPRGRRVGRTHLLPDFATQLMANSSIAMSFLHSLGGIILARLHLPWLCLPVPVRNSIVLAEAVCGHLCLQEAIKGQRIPSW